MNLAYITPLGTYERAASLAHGARLATKSLLKGFFDEDADDTAARLQRWADQYREQQPSYASDIDAALDRYQGIGRG